MLATSFKEACSYFAGYFIFLPIFLLITTPLMGAEQKASLEEGSKVFIPDIRTTQPVESKPDIPKPGDLTAQIIKSVTDTDSYTVLPEKYASDKLDPYSAERLSHCSDAGCIIDTGKLIKADFVIFSQLGRVGDEFVITMFLIETESKEIINQEVISIPFARQLISGCAVVSSRILGKKAELSALTDEEKKILLKRKAHAEAMAGVDKMVVLFTSVTGMDENTLDSTAMTNLASATIADLGMYDVISKEDLSALLKNLSDKLRFDYTNIDRLVEIGNKLGARYLFYSNVGKVIDEYVVSVNLIDSEKNAVVNRVSLLVKDSRQVAEAMKVATLNLFGKPARLRAISEITRTDVLWRSSVVPGWGQLHNDKIAWGGVFLGGFIASLGATVTGFAMYEYQLDKRDKTTNLNDRQNENAQLNTWNAVRWATLGTTLCIYALNLVHAAVMDLPVDSNNMNQDEMISFGINPENQGMGISAELRF